MKLESIKKTFMGLMPVAVIGAAVGAIAFAAFPISVTVAIGIGAVAAIITSGGLVVGMWIGKSNEQQVIEEKEAKILEAAEEGRLNAPQQVKINQQTTEYRQDVVIHISREEYEADKARVENIEMELNQLKSRYQTDRDTYDRDMLNVKKKLPSVWKQSDLVASQGVFSNSSSSSSNSNSNAANDESVTQENSNRPTRERGSKRSLRMN